MTASKFMVIGGVPASLETLFAVPADVVCLDLEDTVPAAKKAAARASVAALCALAVQRGRRFAVRISSIATPDGLEDLQLMRSQPVAPYMVVMARTESARDVGVVRALLQPVLGDFHLQAIIETAEALAQVEAIAQVPALTSLSLGGKDLSEALRVDRAWEPMLYARSRCSAAAARAGIDIVDGPESHDDLAALEAHCRRIKAMGYAGKSAVKAAHWPVIRNVWPETAVSG